MYFKLTAQDLHVWCVFGNLDRNYFAVFWVLSLNKICRTLCAASFDDESETEGALLLH